MDAIAKANCPFRHLTPSFCRYSPHERNDFCFISVLCQRCPKVKYDAISFPKYDWYGPPQVRFERVYMICHDCLSIEDPK